MVLTFDKKRQRAATRRGVLADPAGKSSIMVAAVLAVLAPIGAVACNALIGASWGGSYDYDPAVALTMSIIVAVLFLVAAFVIALRAWMYHSCGIGSLRDQLVAVDTGWLTYSFRVATDLHVNARNVIVVRLSPRETTVTIEQPSGLIRLQGSVWRYFDLDITNPGTKLFLANGTTLAPTYGAVPPVDQLEHVGSFGIPDSFVPDLYQAILANYA